MPCENCTRHAYAQAMDASINEMGRLWVALLPQYRKTQQNAMRLTAAMALIQITPKAFQAFPL